jgi:hypothetical protein
VLAGELGLDTAHKLAAKQRNHAQRRVADHLLDAAAQLRNRHPGRDTAIA